MLIDAALRFPTVIFTIGLGIILIYWVFVLLGALDIDLFGDADVSGAGKGIGDAIVAAKGGGDAIVGGAKAGAEAIKPDLDVDTGGVWSGLGLSKVPVTISISTIFLVCWCISLLAMHYAPSLVGTASWVPGVVLVGTLVVGMPTAGLLVRPLGGVFELKEGKSNRDYVGHTCTITTGRVDEHFGQATVEDGGTVLVIPVRCDRSDALARGHKALIIDFDSERQAYVVEPVADMLPAAEGAGSGTTT
ncbi:MAG TPA: hypothetical protein VFQ53_26205 [Kofleriaceae bacterium]|nr:hypothetical protein [Kofleriaceae bacterium]